MAVKIVFVRVVHPGPFAAARQTLFIQHQYEGVHSGAVEVERLNKNAAMVDIDLEYFLSSAAEYHAWLFTQQKSGKQVAVLKKGF